MIGLWLAESFSITHTAASTDTDYNAGNALFSPSPSVNVFIQDDDHASLVVSQGFFYLLEGSGTSYSVQLSSQLENPVVLTITSDTSRVVSVPTSVTWPVNAWSTVETIAINTVHDDVVYAAPLVATLTHVLTSSDTKYDAAALILPQSSLSVHL